MTYLPRHFHEQDPQRLADFVRDHSFGALVTVADGAPFASHLPLIFDADCGPKGTLRGHMARANPQWGHFKDGSSVLTIFEGPHTYISPAWYAAGGVPTWNYTAVHVYGKPKLLDDKASVGAIVKRLTEIHEARFSPPWEADLTAPRIERVLEHIVGFEIEITSIEGKMKLSQNRTTEDRKRVIARLAASNSETDAAVAKLMSEVLERSGG